MEKTVYILPGRGEQITYLGTMVQRLGYGFQGRQWTDEFESLPFPEQLKAIKQDLENGFWMPDAVLLGRSYGAYLLLHTLADMPPFPGKIILFSPVLGPAAAQKRGYGSIPPRAKKLLNLSENGALPAPACLEIHTGADDNGCDPMLAKKFAASIKTGSLFVVEGAGHFLYPAYMLEALRRFLD